MVNRKRTSVINLRVTPQEKERIERFAKKCRLSVSEYLRQLANGYAPRELPAELIDDGVNGLLVPKRDTAAAADAICRLIEDPELAGR